MSLFKKRQAQLGGLLGARVRKAVALAGQDVPGTGRGLDGFDAPPPSAPADTAHGVISRKAAEVLAGQLGAASFESAMVALARKYPDAHVRAQVCGAVLGARQSASAPVRKADAPGPSAGPVPTAKRADPGQFDRMMALARQRAAAGA